MKGKSVRSAAQLGSVAAAIALLALPCGLAMGQVAATTTTRAQAEQSVARIALVIGNGSYKDAPLTNPVNDARAIVQALKD
ncbi:MAG: caspase family protein, partial [Rhodoferax sp.]